MKPDAATTPVTTARFLGPWLRSSPSAVRRGASAGIRANVEPHNHFVISVGSVPT